MANALRILKFIWIYVCLIICQSDEFAHNNVIFTNQPCPEGQEGVFYAVDHSPSQYKHCGPAGFFWIFPCSPGTFFSQMEQACVLPSNSTTISSIINDKNDIVQHAAPEFKSTTIPIRSTNTTPVPQIIHTQSQMNPVISTTRVHPTTTVVNIFYTKQGKTTTIPTPRFQVESSSTSSSTTAASTTISAEATPQLKTKENVLPTAPQYSNHQDTTTSVPPIEFDLDEEMSATTVLPFSAMEPKIFATVGPHPDHEEEYQDYELDTENHSSKDQHHSQAITITVTAPTTKLPLNHKTEDVEYWNENTAESPPIPLHPIEKPEQHKSTSSHSSPVPVHAHDPEYEHLQPSFVALENQQPNNNISAQVKENYEYHMVTALQTVTPHYVHVELPETLLSIHEQTNEETNNEPENHGQSQSLMQNRYAASGVTIGGEIPPETESSQDHLWSYESKLQVRPPQYEIIQPVHPTTETPLEYSVQEPESQQQQEMHYIVQHQKEYPQELSYAKPIDREADLHNPAYEIKHNEEQQPGNYHYYTNHYETVDNIISRTPSSKALPKSATATLSPQAQELAKKISQQDLESMRRVFETIASAASAQGNQGGGGGGSGQPPPFLPPAFQLPPNVLNNQFINGPPMQPHYAQFGMGGNGFAPFQQQLPPPITELPPTIFMVSECKENGTCEFNAIGETYCLHESDPTFYYQCGPSADDTGVWMNRQCPAGLHFNDDGQCGKKRKINKDNSEKLGQSSSQNIPPTPISRPPIQPTPDYYQPNPYTKFNTILPPKSEENTYEIPQPAQIPAYVKQEQTVPVEYPTYVQQPKVSNVFENQINNPKLGLTRGPIINSYQQIVQRPNYPESNERQIIPPVNTFLPYPEQIGNYAEYPQQTGGENLNRPLPPPVRPMNPNLAKWVVDQQPTKPPLIPSQPYPHRPHQPVQTVRGGYLPASIVAKLASLDSMAQAIAAKNVFSGRGQPKIEGYAVKPANQPVPLTSGQNLFATYGTNYLLAGHPVTYMPNPYSQMGHRANYDPRVALPSGDYANQKPLLLPRQPQFPRPQIATSRDEAALIWHNTRGDTDKSPEGTTNVWRPTAGQRCSLLASPRAQVFSNPSDYKTFYMCLPKQGGDDLHISAPDRHTDSAEGSWALMQCPEDTVFNASLKVCDRSYTDFKQKKLTI